MSRPERTPVVLCILDGVGDAPAGDGNAVVRAAMPHFQGLRARHLATRLRASGAAVGDPEGTLGSGEAGLLALGAGRIVPRPRTAIDEAIARNRLGRNAVLDQLYQIAVYDGCPLHLVGLLSTAGVHSDFEHLLALVDLAAFHEVPVVVHAVLDGVDMPPKSAATLLDRLQLHLEGKRATIGTLAGRHYAMAPEGRWDRAHLAFQAIVRDNVLGPTAPRAETAFDALNLAYLQGATDAYVEPVRLGDYQGFRGDFVCDFTGSPPVWEWNGEDCGLVFHHRGDGLRALTMLLAREGAPDEVAKDLLMDRHHPVRAFREHCLATLAPTAESLSLPVAFPRDPVPSTLGEVVARAGLRQLRLGESDQRHHVTTLLDAGRERPHEGTTHDIVPSPMLVERAEDRPALHVARVADRAVAALEEGRHELLVVHLGNAERVAGGGASDDAVCAALEALDAALGRIAAATLDAGGTLVVTADHGGCEALRDERGRPRGPHSAGPVPLVVAGHGGSQPLREGGSLADVAPTVLDLLGLPKPPEMTGSSLLVP